MNTVARLHRRFILVVASLLAFIVARGMYSEGTFLSADSTGAAVNYWQATVTPHPTAGHEVNSNTPPVSPVIINVNGGQRYQTFQGFGGSLTVFEDIGVYRRHDASQPEVTTATGDDRAGIAQLLYSELGIARTRVVLRGFEPVNDNDDPFSLNPAAFDWSLVDANIDFLTLGTQVGLQTYWASFALDYSPGDAWRQQPDNACALDPAQIDEEVEWLLAAALHFRDAGLPLPYMTINNEPDLCPPGFKIEVDTLVAIVNRLGARLRAEGLDTMLVIADNWIPQNGLLYMQAALADSNARQYVGALAYHSYDGYDNPALLLETSVQGAPPHTLSEAREQIRDLAAAYNLPVWMTEVCYCAPREFSDFDLIRIRLNHVHDELTITNIAAFDVMNLLFLDRPGVRDELVHVYFAPDGALDRYEISSYGYMIGHYSRFASPGSVRIEATSTDPRIRVTAFERPDNRLVIVALNNTSAEVEVILSPQGLTQSPGTLSVLRSQEGAIWQTGADLSAQDGAFTDRLAPFSITTYLGEG